MVIAVSLLVRADVHVVEEHFAALDFRKGILHVYAAGADGLNLRSLQHDACFIGFFYKVIMVCFLFCDNTLPDPFGMPYPPLSAKPFMCAIRFILANGSFRDNDGA